MFAKGLLGGDLLKRVVVLEGVVRFLRRVYLKKTEFGDGSVTTNKLANKAVTGAKISMTYEEAPNPATDFTTTTTGAYVDVGIALSFTTTNTGTAIVSGKVALRHSVANARYVVRVVDQAGVELCRALGMFPATANVWTTASLIHSRHYLLDANVTYTFKIQLYSYDAGTVEVYRTMHTYSGLIAHIFGAK